MTRGNQRDEARAKNLKAAAGKGPSSAERKEGDGMTPAQRKERDSKAVQEKIAKKAADAAAAAGK